MPRRLSKPTDLPSDHERLIDMLWRFYAAADDPSTRRIAEAIEELDDDQRKGTANPETIRRTLRAMNEPPRVRCAPGYLSPAGCSAWST